ncbi:SDR family oxidoreductase [Actinoplanes sp. NPDC051411]|uniref:SDR family NAD(P)-dependent oxidoreductase n=1 Tax=Actinoplanes sp. NPDC051411 TaxID=3155522 RepID=UPI00342E651B
MLLEGRNAIVYGGGGSIGGAMARAFAEQGAHVFLAGRTQAGLDAVAAEIVANGGRADTAIVDARDEAAVDAHADEVARAAGGIQISVNVITDNDVQGKPAAEMAVADYLAPVEVGLRSRFLTARAAARHMKQQRDGVILMFGGDGDRSAHRRNHQLGGLVTGFSAIEALRRQLACELGEYGIRVITLQTGGVPESIPAELEWRAPIEKSLVESTLLGRAATLEDVGNVAVFAASDWARTITGAAINMTCGAFVD